LPLASGMDEPDRFLLVGFGALALGLLAQLYVVRQAAG